VHYNNASESGIFGLDQLTATHHTLTVNVHGKAGPVPCLNFQSMAITTGDGEDSRCAVLCLSLCHIGG
jgi:hypothetical protein